MNKKVILPLLCLGLIFFGFRLLVTNYTPLKCTVAEYEKRNDPDAHDFYILSGGRTTGSAYYAKNAITGVVNQFVYPVVSKEMIKDAIARFVSTHSDSSNEGLDDWLAQNLHPKVFVLSEKEKIGKDEMVKHIDDVDSAVITGERIRLGDNISDKIKEGLEKNGYKDGSYLLIKENATIDKSPDGSKGAGAILMGLGVFFLYRIYRKKKPAAAPAGPGTGNGGGNTNAGGRPTGGDDSAAYAFVSPDANKGVSMDEAQKLRDEFLAVAATNDKQKEFNLASGMMLNRAYDACIEAYQMLAAKYPNESGKCLGQIGAAWFFKGDYNKAIDNYVAARQNGDNADMMDDNIFEVCEAMYNQSKNRSDVERYKQLCPGGRHTAEAERLLR